MSIVRGGSYLWIDCTDRYSLMQKKSLKTQNRASFFLTLFGCFVISDCYIAKVVILYMKQVRKPKNQRSIEIMERKQYVCPKCGCQSYVNDQFQATGGDFARIFDIQNKKFITISCTNCGYTELYKAQTSSGMDILDFLLGN